MSAGSSKRWFPHWMRVRNDAWAPPPPRLPPPTLFRNSSVWHRSASPLQHVCSLGRQLVGWVKSAARDWLTFQDLLGDRAGWNTASLRWGRSLFLEQINTFFPSFAAGFTFTAFYSFPHALCRLFFFAKTKTRCPWKSKFLIEQIMASDESVVWWTQHPVPSLIGHASHENHCFWAQTKQTLQCVCPNPPPPAAKQNIKLT